MMLQFTVWHRSGGKRDLMVTNTDEWDYFYGFSRFIKTLES